MFGVVVDDPYRWLEKDVRAEPRVADWAAAQQRLTGDYLAGLPGRDAIAARLTALWDHERVSLPVKRGGRYFHLRNAGLAAQPSLCVRDTIDAAPRVLIDPLAWGEGDTRALAEWQPSNDGHRLAYAVQTDGSDWRTLHILDVAGGESLDDRLEHVKYSGIAWAGNGSGFFYSRFPAPKSGTEHQAANQDHGIWFHRVGTPQSADFAVYATPDRPRLSHGAEVTEDGRWLLISSYEGADARCELTLVDLTKPRLTATTLIRGQQNRWRMAGSAGEIVYFVTDLDAPRQRLVAMDVTSAMRRLRVVVGEEEAVLEDARLIGGRLVLVYLRDMESEVRLVDPRTGRAAGAIALPGIGSVGAIEGVAAESEGFFRYASYDRPAEIHRFDVADGTQTLFARPSVSFDPATFLVERIAATAADGTAIPIFLLRRRDVAEAGRPAPTILHGYGGFAISLLPGFSPAALAWAEMGGAYAVANIRGGGEYGTAWHEAGRRHAKQTVFDDFIAAASHLRAAGTVGEGGLAIHGVSNGGLLVSAVTNQRPDLFAAALPVVGVHDMLRFPQFTAGRYWVDEYGDPANEADFRALAAYSPLHNVRDGVDYPAILIATADTDDRVVPAHSFKYAAAVQAAAIGDKPHLIRIESRAGHGAGKSTQARIAEEADLWAFAARWTGLGTQAR
ncbi:MAG TPA: prolyl oligopeptidase family serine peptidase [Sphingomonas sp.]